VQVINKICGSFIYIFPKYRKMWSEVVSFNKRYPSNKEYTYRDFFIHNVGVGVFFSDYHYPRGLLHKLYYYIGCKTGWLKRYKLECDRSMENARSVLEECFTEDMINEIKKFNK